MKMNKKVKEYMERYSHLPKDKEEILIYLMDLLKINRNDILKIREEITRIVSIPREKISVNFYFTPQATPRARLSGKSFKFYVKTDMNYNQVFGLFVSTCKELKGVITTPCRLLVKTYSPIPNNMNRIDKVLSEIGLIPHISKPDWDNFGKTYSDMVQKHLILDDCLIYDGRVIKGYSLRPRIEIEIEYMTEYDSKYNKKKVESWK